MAWQIFGQNNLSGHNYLGVNEDGSINVEILNDDLPITIDNPFPVEIPPCICEGNSSNTPLTSGGVFTGDAERCNGYGIIYINVYSDVASATDGLEIQQSSDGTNWDHKDYFSIPAGTGKTFSINPFAKYFRILYTNGAIDQTEFRIQTILKNTGLPSSHRIQDAISSDDDGQLVKSVITGQDETGVFKNVKTTTDGNLSISDNSSGLAISQGNVTGVTYVHKFGEAPDYDTGDNEVDVWDGANDSGINQMTYVWSTSAVIDSISSSSASDTQPILIQGLDENLELVQQQVTLNGQTRVALTTPLIRVFRGKNNGFNDLVGSVFVYENTALSSGVPTDTTKIRLNINDGNNQTLMAIYTVPIDKDAYMRSFYAATAGASKSSSYIIKLWAREYDSDTASWKAWQLKHIQSISDTGNSTLQYDYKDPQKFAGGTDLRMTVQMTATGASGAATAAGFDLVLVDK